MIIKNKTNQSKNIEEYYSLGDTVSTDILSFQLISSEFTYALDSAGNPKEYNEQEDKNNTRVASKGHTLVAFTFLVENKDRTEIYIGDEERLGNKKNTCIFASVEYNNEHYGDVYNANETVFQIDSKNKNNTKFVKTSKDMVNWESDNIFNGTIVKIEANAKQYVRAYIDIPVEVNSLDDTVKLAIYLHNSEDKKETFTFSISEEDRNNHKFEISEKVAIDNIGKKTAEEYFMNHLDEYSKLSREEIKTALEGKKYNVNIVYDEIKNINWQGSFLFETSGKVNQSIGTQELGYLQNRTWKIDNDLLVMTSNYSADPISYEVRKVNDEVYLLVVDNKIKGYLY